ncbi:Hydroxymethylglutaryl-CoA lyase YngG [uncultured Sporomusa sp.]|uniref:Hydroxymethylglutaryl-CoA lyase YngG n=1 Tax=uncultured Sporomusa sp. TaxID=307249 RepID=A0A212M1N1_9FIRM|nr:Hydroxymethylglutaryl-CoA lyase YngG [uncultured Sporomusa sp.]
MKEAIILKLPQEVEIIEVCPRDGFQNIKTPIPAETKIEIIDKLVGCGFKWIEATSFVHPKAIPQMADAAQVLQTVKEKHAGKVSFIALAPNLFGAQRAIEAGADAITFVISASEKHNLENTKQTIEQSVAALTEVCKIKGDCKVRLAVATAFDCPFAGKVEPEQVISLVEAGLAAGADDIVLADTIGTATPLQMEALLKPLTQKYPQFSFILHIHDTQGMGLANVVTALSLGVTRFETAAFGLGGCPFAPGAAGNIATEDLVNMLHKMDIATGLNYEKILQVAHCIQEKLGIPPMGHLARIAACQG